jgi:hypothetical protein
MIDVYGQTKAAISVAEIYVKPIKLSRKLVAVAEGLHL